MRAGKEHRLSQFEPRYAHSYHFPEKTYVQSPNPNKTLARISPASARCVKPSKLSEH